MITDEQAKEIQEREREARRLLVLLFTQLGTLHKDMAQILNEATGYGLGATLQDVGSFLDKTALQQEESNE